MTFGFPTWNSYFSLLIVSIRIERWRIPLPNTLNLSSKPVSSTRSARFFSISLKSLSRKCLEVTYFPSLPKNGELLIVNNILIVGSSTFILVKGSGFSRSAMVSPISNSSRPTTAQISPLRTSSTFSRLSPLKR